MLPLPVNHERPDLAEVIQSLLGLRQDVQSLRLDLHLLATKQDLKHTERTIMSAISDFAAKVNAFNDRIDAAIAGLQGDVKNLEDQIAALQNSAGQITPEDQALLDGIQARASTVADKLDALDALTPPVAPTP